MTMPATRTEAASSHVHGLWPVYVGDLHPDVIDADLLELFSSIGPVELVKVCRDYFTGISCGYGYVNYISEHDAINAIKKLNHYVLHGMPIRVMFKCVNSESRKSGIGNIFVKNLSGSVDAIKLREMFSKFGTILSCKVAIQDGESKGYGFAQFDSQDIANVVIKNFNGTLVEGKKIYVGRFIKKSDRVLQNTEQKYTNLYMKNLDKDITEEFIELKFSEFGKIINVVIERDEEGKSKGFGFVNFVNPESVQKAVEIMNGLQLGSKKLYVARAQSKAERKEIMSHDFEGKHNKEIRNKMASNLYVKNIDDSVDDNALWEHFNRWGNITSAKVMRDDKGINKGFGFVCFSTEVEAVRAKNTLHGYMFHGKPLYVAIAERKEERRARMMHLHNVQRMVGLEAGSTVDATSTSYSPNFYAPARVMESFSAQDQLTYRSFGPRSVWQPSKLVPPSSTMSQHVPFPVTHGDMNNLLPALPALSNAHEMEMLCSMLVAATPQQQKDILGQLLFPLVEKIKPNLATKINEMLLEMDSSELLILLESPESLAAKVEEAILFMGKI